jgi:hypothetical protein
MIFGEQYLKQYYSTTEILFTTVAPLVITVAFTASKSEYHHPVPAPCARWTDAGEARATECIGSRQSCAVPAAGPRTGY